MTELEDFSRLKILRKDMRMNQKAFAEMLDVNPVSISQYETKAKGIPYNLARKMYFRMMLNVNWLIGGEGEMIRSKALTSDWTITANNSLWESTLFTEDQIDTAAVNRLLAENHRLKELISIIERSLKDSQFMIDTLRSKVKEYEGEKTAK